MTRLVSLDPELYYSAPLSVDPPPVAFFESAKHASHGKSLLRAVKSSDVTALEGLLFPLAPFATSEASTALSTVTQRHGVVGLVNFVDENGLSPLHHAVRVQPAPDLQVFKLLFAAGADLNLACVSRSTPLHHLACLGGSDRELTRRNFLIGQKLEQTQSTPSADSERLRTIQNTVTTAGLPLSGGETEAPSEIGNLPEVKIDDKETFVLANSETEHHLKEAVTLLLRLGSCPDIADCAGALPLHFAAEVRFTTI